MPAGMRWNRRATHRIRDGQSITVDGGAGTVTLE